MLRDVGPTRLDSCLVSHLAIIQGTDRHNLAGCLEAAATYGLALYWLNV